MSALEDFLRFYMPHPDLSKFCRSFSKTIIQKGELLLQPGDDSRFLAFVETGCFRVYYYEYSGREITTWFSTEQMMVTDLYSFYTEEKATFYVEALEDSRIYIISKNRLERLYKDHPEYINFGKHFAEEALTMVMKRMLDLQTKSAEERYKELLTTTDLADRVPLKHLASFLGITDTSLSRIRRNITG